MKTKKGKLAGSLKLALGYSDGRELMTMFHDIEILSIKDLKKTIELINREVKLFERNMINLHKQPHGVFLNEEANKIIVNKTLKRKRTK
jgi:hypothetical protein